MFFKKFVIDEKRLNDEIYDLHDEVTCLTNTLRISEDFAETVCVDRDKQIITVQKLENEIKNLQKHISTKDQYLSLLIQEIERNENLKSHSRKYMIQSETNNAMLDYQLYQSQLAVHLLGKHIQHVYSCDDIDTVEKTFLGMSFPQPTEPDSTLFLKSFFAMTNEIHIALNHNTKQHYFKDLCTNINNIVTEIKNNVNLDCSNNDMFDFKNDIELKNNFTKNIERNEVHNVNDTKYSCTDIHRLMTNSSPEPNLQNDIDKFLTQKRNSLPTIIPTNIHIDNIQHITPPKPNTTESNNKNTKIKPSPRKHKLRPFLAGGKRKTILNFQKIFSRNISNS